jgi:hypothetical protein
MAESWAGLRTQRCRRRPTASAPLSLPLSGAPERQRSVKRILVPKRSNEFQHLVTLIERLLSGSDARVTESKDLTDNIIGKPREVNIV